MRKLSTTFLSSPRIVGTLILFVLISLGNLWSVMPVQAESTLAARKMLIVGDSLSAEYGLAKGKGWVALLEKQIQSQHFKTAIINASISGETTSGGKQRLAALLKQHDPDIVVIELGGNDGVRGLSLNATEKNLSDMIQMIQTHTAHKKIKAGNVILIPMKIPPNYGKAYTEQFFNLYSKLGKTHKVEVSTFFLEGVADKPELFQADKIHPTEAAHPIMLKNIWPSIKKVLSSP